MFLRNCLVSDKRKVMDSSEAGAGAVLGEDFSGGRSEAVFRLGLQRHCGADREERLEDLPDLLLMGRLRHLGGIHTGESERERLGSVEDAEGIAATDRHQRGSCCG